MNDLHFWNFNLLLIRYQVLNDAKYQSLLIGHKAITITPMSMMIFRKRCRENQQTIRRNENECIQTGEFDN